VILERSILTALFHGLKDIRILRARAIALLSIAWQRHTCSETSPFLTCHNMDPLWQLGLAIALCFVMMVSLLPIAECVDPPWSRVEDM
jgi:hypothetical protein